MVHGRQRDDPSTIAMRVSHERLTSYALKQIFCSHFCPSSLCENKIAVLLHPPVGILPTIREFWFHKSKNTILSFLFHALKRRADQKVINRLRQPDDPLQISKFRKLQTKKTNRVESWGIK